MALVSRRSGATLALLALAVITAIAGSTASAHLGHPQKKLFNGHWYRIDFALPMDLTTDNFLYGLGTDWDGDGFVDYCDGGYSYPTEVNTASCVSKWAAPFQESINDWNAQPMDVNFIQTGTVDENNDITVLVTDLVLGDPGILGIGLLFDSNGDFCFDYDTCTYRYGVAWQADDPHASFYGTNSVRRATVIHEVGHLINLRHESVNADESVHYECGFDNTGPIPVSVMAYDCIDPPIVGGSGISSVQNWDTCGVNHKYYDPAFAYSECGYDEDNDTVDEPPDNCPGVYNPTQSNVDGDGLGDACDPDIDGDGIANGTDPDADGDKVYNNDETNCGADALDGSRRPERIDGPFAGVNDDGDGQTDEALPPGATQYDCDGDGFKGSVEASVFSGGGNGDRDACGNNGWPADLAVNDNKLNIGDLNSFLFPLGPDDGHGPFAYFNHTVPDAGRVNEERWNLDIAGGAGVINIGDLNALNPAVNSPTSKPPMFGGQAAFFTNLGQCPWPP